jgi:hypothetical protein
MMSEPKPFASLSSGLLARKGQARPAMRPQGFTGGYSSLANGVDDLGWNDMGHSPDMFGEVHGINEDQILPPPAGVPAVLAERQALKQKLIAPVLDEEGAEPEDIEAEAAEAKHHVTAPTVAVFEPRPVSVAAATRIAKATKHKHKAAFTLRLDEERHLRLRLASAVSGRSAQQLVTEALDAFLESVPEVSDLARQIPQRANG